MSGLLGKLSPRTSGEESNTRRRGAMRAPTTLPTRPGGGTDVREQPQIMGSATVVMSSIKPGAQSTPSTVQIPMAVKASSIDTVEREPLPPARWASVSINQQPSLLELLREARRELAAEQVKGEDEKLSVIERARKVFERVKDHKKDLATEVVDLGSWMFDGVLQGYGPLKPLLDDTHVTQIFIDGLDRIRCLRGGEYVLTPLAFVDSQEYQQYLERLLALAKLDVAPLVESRSTEIAFSVPDAWKTRVQLVRPPGGNLTQARLVLHLARLEEPNLYELTKLKMLPAGLAALLHEFTQQSVGSLLVAGPSCSGKSTLIRVLLSDIVEKERVLVVEHAGEMRLAFDQIESSNIPSEALDFGEFASRHAAQRIVLADVTERIGGLMVQSTEAGYPGTIGCVHATSPATALWKLADGLSRVSRATQEQMISRVSASVSLIVVTDLLGGVPVVKEVVEVLPSDGIEFCIRPLLRIEVQADGSHEWRLQSAHSLLLRKLRERGIILAEGQGVLPMQGNERRPLPT